MLIQRLKFLVFILIGLMLSLSSCRKNSYPCPGAGQSSAKDFSKFDEDGNLKDSAKRKKITKNDRGLVNKKQDTRLRNRRKKTLDDKPKNMKK